MVVPVAVLACVLVTQPVVYAEGSVPPVLMATATIFSNHVTAPPPMPIATIVPPPTQPVQVPPQQAPTLPPILQPLAPYLPVLQSSARTYQIPSSLVEALAIVESHGNPSIVSSTGAVGLLQIEPRTARWLGLPYRTISQQVIAGVAYLHWLADQVGATPTCLSDGPSGTPSCAWQTDRMLSGYYAGLAGRYAAGYVEAVRRVWVAIS